MIKDFELKQSTGTLTFDNAGFVNVERFVQLTPDEAIAFASKLLQFGTQNYQVKKDA